MKRSLFVAALTMLPHVALAQASNPLLGRDLAASCAMCHGTEGRSAGVTEALAGRPAKEIVATLKLFREGTKPATIMNQIAKGYTDAQVEAIAEYFSDQQPAGR